MTPVPGFLCQQKLLWLHRYLTSARGGRPLQVNAVKGRGLGKGSSLQWGPLRGPHLGLGGPWGTEPLRDPTFGHDKQKSHTLGI